MTRRVVVVAVVAAWLLSTGSDSLGRDPQWWGLAAIAVSPDGKTVVTGGQNRVLYVLDGQTLKVTRRIWFETRLGWAAYNRDGSVLVTEDERQHLHFLDAKTYEKIAVLPDCYVRAFHRSADVLATVVFDRKERKNPGYVRFLSLTDGSEKGRATLPTRNSGYMTFTPDGKRLIVLVRQKDSAEEVVKRADIPKNMKGQARLEFEQKHDGYTSKLLAFAVPSGKLLKTTNVWYSGRRGRLNLVTEGDDVLVFQETNENARIRPDGKVTLFRTGIAGSARCVAEDHKALLVCSGDRAVHIHVRDMKETRLNPKAGTITGFTFLPDGSSFVVTNGYRLVRIGPDGKLKSTTPVY